MVRGTRKKWTALIAQWASSGLTANQFAVEAKINAGTLQYYKWLIGRDSRTELRTSPGPKTKIGFVEVRTDVLASAADSSADDRIEVVLAGGTRVLVSNRFDAMAFRRVVDALEASR
jgi:hypothetical protein